MRFALKIVCVSIMAVALALSLGAAMLVQLSFEQSLSRETQRALDEQSLIKMGFETAAVTYAIQDIDLDLNTVLSIAEQLGQGRALALLDEQGQMLYGHFQIPSLFGAASTNRNLAVLRGSTGDYLYVCGPLVLGDERYQILCRTDIRDLYSQRDSLLANFLGIYAAVLGLSSLLVFGLSVLLTRPLSRLARTSRQIAGGQYELRAAQRGSDEVAQFTADFKRMTDALVDKLDELAQAVEQRETFVANFAHELKTPLTSIIGYADVLRSQELSKERIFRCSNTIFNEGRRLEALSIKLLELMVVGKQELQRKRVNPRLLAQDLELSLAPLLQASHMALRVRVQDGVLLADPDLLKTLLYNLIDNARKASEPGSELLLHGAIRDNRYIFSVADRGRGIPKEEIHKITQAFYMVDKSRARAQNGAGLGLALCEKIAQLHGGRLSIQSELGKGTVVRLVMEVAP